MKEESLYKYPYNQQYLCVHWQYYPDFGLYHKIMRNASNVADLIGQPTYFKIPLLLILHDGKNTK